jgi:peptidoglycan L-alanyl-D-glutamate endopeptidase CwlK
MKLDDIIRAVQKTLGVDVDGRAGPETWGAIYSAVVKRKAPGVVKKIPPGTLLPAGKTADSRSEPNVATLDPRVQPYARALIQKAAAAGIVIKVISGTRTYEEQAELYKKYKVGGPLAAAPGRSNHNFGIAFDIGVFSGSSDPEKAKTYIPESPVYKTIGALGVELGLAWGGNWKKTPDEPHFELRPSWAKGLGEGDMIKMLADRKAKGTDVFA